MKDVRGQATSMTNSQAGENAYFAPRFSNLSSSWIDLATVTPSTYSQRNKSS